MQKLTRRAFMLGTTCLGLSSSPAFAWGRLFGQGGAMFTPPSVALTCSPTSVSIATTQTGTVTTFTVGGGNPNSYTFSLSGAYASSFALTGATGTTVSLSVPTALSAGSYNFALVATNAAGSATFPITASVGGVGLVTTMVVTNTTSSAQTNVPVTFGLPLAAGVLTGGLTLQVIDNTTSNALAVQQDAAASDLSGNVRFVAPTVILPNLAANETRTLTINTIGGSATAGTSIAASDILATAFDHVVTVQDHSGNTYTASARSGLAAGAYTNSTTAATLGGHRGGGGLANEFVVMVPLKTSGGTAHPQLRAIFDIVAFKVGTGAVGTGNPIIAIRSDRVLENSWLRTAPATTDDWYGFSDTCGSTTINNFVNQSPSASLAVTIDPANPNAPKAITASAALFSLTQTSSAVGIGCVISDGTGVGTITGITDSTHATIQVYKAFANLSSNTYSLAGGGYTVYGANHPFGGRHRQRMWFDGLAKPQYTVNLGPAWNGSTSTGGPGPYIASTGLTLNYATPVGSVPTATSAAPNMAAQGNNPTAFGGGMTGDITMYMGATGERGEVGICTAWDITALIRYDANALPVLLFEADKFSLAPFNFRSPTTGLAGRMDTLTDWVVDSRFLSLSSAALVAMAYGNAATPWISADWGMDLAHMGDTYYLPYLLTGDWYWLDCLEMWGQYSWLSGNPDICGSQINRVNFDAQTRGQAWGLRTLSRLALLTPDANSSALGWSKSHVQSWLAAHWTAPRGQGTYSVGGALVEFVNSTGAGQKYLVNGPHWTNLGGKDGGASYAPWQNNYFIGALIHAKKMGMLDSNGQSFLAWLAVDTIGWASNPSLADPQYAVIAYYTEVCTPNTSTYFNDWASAYQRTANSAWASRQLPGTMTVVDASNPAATKVTVPTGYFNTTSFYLLYGGWVTAYNPSQNNASLGGGAITAIAVNSPAGYDTLTLDTTGATNASALVGSLIGSGAFQQTSFPSGWYTVPNPAVGDALGVEITNPSVFPANNGTDYYPLAKSALYLLAQDGSFPGAAAAYATVNGWAPSSWGPASYELKWHVQ